MTPREEVLARALTATEVLDQVATGVVVTDKNGVVLFANAFAAGLLGADHEPAELVGRPVASLGLERGDAAAMAHMADNVLRGWPWEGTLASVRADGSRVYVRVHAVPLRAESGETAGIVIMAREPTRRGGQRASDRIGLLERIGERLASSLELDVTLREVAEILVPQFADHCFIDLLHGETLVRRVQFNSSGWQPQPGTWALVGEQINYPKGHFCEQAMSRLDTIVVADLAEESFPPPRPESQQICDDIRLSSVLAAPLVARGELLGVMSLALSGVTQREERHYSADDRDFLSAIASRVAIAIDNSLLFEEERRTALAFQTSLLPMHPPSVDGLEVAYKYVPAKPLETHGQGIQTQVGGDWYDIIPLSAGRVGIVIGDVEGRGARAAAVMGQLRAALRAFAQDDKSPAEILRRLDDWVRTLSPVADSHNSSTSGAHVGPHGSPVSGQYGAGGAGLHDTEAADPPTVSCTYLVYDAWSRTLSFANAGHVPPLLLRGHEVSQLEIRDRGVLLGVRGKGVRGLPTYREEVRYLPPGSTLVFYTDGLVDRRQRVDGNGHYTDGEVQEMLRAAVRSAADGSVAEIARAAENAVPGAIDDDMAVVVVRTSPVDLASWEGQFPAEPIRVSEARKLAHDTFTSWGMDVEQADLACLLVSEVVTNVVLHATVSPTPRHELVLEGAGPGPLGILGDWELAPYDDSFSNPAGKDFTLRLRRGHEAIWVEVFDSDLRLPRIRSAGESDEGGRGLYLVDQLATRWGSRPTKDGKAVWFEMPIKGSAGSRLL
jgi:PAS domain S-box-containing protein